MIRKFISISLMTFLCLFSIIPVESRASETNYSSEKISVVGYIGESEESKGDDHLVIEVKVPEEDNFSQGPNNKGNQLPKLGVNSINSYLIAGVLLLFFFFFFFAIPDKKRD